MSKQFNMDGIKITKIEDKTTARKRRKQKSPVRHAHAINVSDYSIAPDIYACNSDAVDCDEPVTFPGDATDNTENCKKAKTFNGGLIEDTGEGTRISLLQTVPIPTVIQMTTLNSGATCGNGFTVEESFGEDNLENHDSVGYGALLGQEAKKKKTITALRCRVCGALLKRSFWQRERNFYSVKSSDILFSLERAVGTTVDKRDGATYGCKACFDKMMRLRSVESQISKLGHEREAIVGEIQKKFATGQKLLRHHNWNGKISSDYFGEDVEIQDDKQSRLQTRQPSIEVRSENKYLSVALHSNSKNTEFKNVAKEVQSLISVSEDLQQSIPENQCTSLVSQSATQLMQRIIARRNEDMKVVLQNQGSSHTHMCSSHNCEHKEIVNNTTREQHPLASNGPDSGTKKQMAGLEGSSEDWSTEDSVEEPLTEQMCDSTVTNVPPRINGQYEQTGIRQKIAKLRGCFVDKFGKQQDVCSVVRAFSDQPTNQDSPPNGIGNDQHMTHTSSGDITPLVNGTAITEYKIAKMNLTEKSFANGSEEDVDVCIKQEPQESDESECGDIPGEKRLVLEKSHQQTEPVQQSTEVNEWKTLPTHRPTQNTIQPLIKVPKVNSPRLGDLSKGFVKHLGLYVCEICGKKYPSKSGYRYHIKIHSGNRPFLCKYCQKSFVEAHILKQHERIHTGVKPYKCQWCDASFAQHSQIRVHERRHTKERPYKCELCDKSFACNASLKAHQNSHENKRPYVCGVCGKSYLWPNHLRSHMKYHQQPSHSCSFCDKKFISPSELKNHVRSHTGERPYVCDLCGKGFTQSCHLGAHRRYTHTNEQQKESLRCIYCDKKCRNYQGTKNHERLCKEKSRTVTDCLAGSLDKEAAQTGDGPLIQVKEEPSFNLEDETESSS